MKKTLIAILMSCSLPLWAQQYGLTDTRNSLHAVMSATPMSAVHWNGGFWGERFQVFSKTSVQSMWATWQTDEGKGFNNFLIASGEKQGVHHGPPFHDGDMYKWLEAVASVYAITKDPELEKIMDRFIGCVVKSQRADGYIHTPVIIKERNASVSAAGTDAGTVVGTATGTKDDKAFENRLNFETYNLGHLITAGIVHKRATGKTTLFNAAVKAANFLYDFCQRAPEELAGNAICPSHYMAVAEIYRETGDPKYLELLKKFIDIRGMVENGTDDNQDRIPFRQQYRAMGHAVRANYLYAGVADLYLESGEEQLMKNLTSIWQDIVTRKMYINGACGALYDGTSPDGTNYKPDSIQKVHQSYGRPYQLPHSTAHNETCANIGNLFFNWRMLEATGDGKYADIVENCLYNSILSGISLDGEKYFYTNPLRLSDELPYTLRWPKERTKYISCFCCPPNTLRTLCEAQNYAYSIGEKTIYVNLFSDNSLNINLQGVGNIVLEQTTDYPWDGLVKMVVKQLKGKKDFKLKLRLPEWCQKSLVQKNGQTITTRLENGYCVVEGTWKKGDEISYTMRMPTRIMESNPLVEENRGQVAIQRGPIVYCAESQDLAGIDIDNIAIPADAQFKPVETTIDGSRLMALEGEVVVRSEAPWTGTLYREVSRTQQRKTIRLIPYYAWGNRGKSEMTVWMPAAY
ncbi:MAG: glycoside hydrolase family 127 protein [Prevotella sp.]|nr:glycoside hydrolase family 127 protein [Prevotella sp.]